MITVERFKEKFQDKVELLGWKINEKRAKLIYEHIMDYEVEDFEKALEIASAWDIFNFQAFEKAIKSSRTQRIESETASKKKEEERAFMIWWKSHKAQKTDCINNYRCFDCKLIYCDVTASACQAAMKALVRREKNEQQIRSDLSRFQGMGWTEPFCKK